MRVVDVTKPDERITPLWAEARRISEPLSTIVNQTFEGGTIYLDGRRWLNCTFRRCHLVITLGLLKVAGQLTIEDCTFEVSRSVRDAQRFPIIEGEREEPIEVAEPPADDVVR